MWPLETHAWRLGVTGSGGGRGGGGVGQPFLGFKVHSRHLGSFSRATFNSARIRPLPTQMCQIETCPLTRSGDEAFVIPARRGQCGCESRPFTVHRAAESRGSRPAGQPGRLHLAQGLLCAISISEHARTHARAHTHTHTHTHCPTGLGAHTHTHTLSHCPTGLGVCECTQTHTHMHTLSHCPTGLGASRGMNCILRTFGNLQVTCH